MLSLFSNDFELFQKSNKYVNLELSSPEYLTLYPQLLLDFIRSYTAYNKLAIFILFKTSLRYKDARELDLSVATKNEFYIVKQHKTSLTIQRNFFIYNIETKKFLSTLQNIEPFFNYVQLKNEIKRQQLLFFRNEKFNYKSETHFFRHVNSTIMLNQGYKKDEVRKSLGHFGKDSIKYYIHSELKNIFSL